jgi:hypothetical protein
MKKIITILLISLSSISFAIGQNARNISNIPLNAVNPIVAQHAQSSGISFTSNQSQYQLILGGRAILQNDNSVAAQFASSSNNNLWSDQKGPFNISIGAGGASANSSLNNNGVSFNQIAYNPQSGNVGIIVGDIIVKLKPNVSAETIASIYGINLIDNFEQINIASYRVQNWQSIFTVTQDLNKNAGIEYAEIDIIENFAYPN